MHEQKNVDHNINAFENIIIDNLNDIYVVCPLCKYIIYIIVFALRMVRI